MSLMINCLGLAEVCLSMALNLFWVCFFPLLLFTIFKHLDKEHHNQWRLSAGEQQVKELICAIPKLHHKELLKLNRSGLRKVIGLLNGHCILKRHLNVMGISPDTFCWGCHLKDETSRHILCE